ncbi:hypothetical protein SAMN05216365_1026 [Porphyromonadaceae bacterium NLAE-zl-C104]|nr:hypothetical protein SAMN05216365_1026 [Porphyromonadaceae bacterium NLAE-zl-C104]
MFLIDFQLNDYSLSVRSFMVNYVFVHGES